MEYKKVKRASLEVSLLALGTWAAGGSNWGGDVDDKKSLRAIHEAAARGVNLIDTAPVYGFGHAEEIVGRALKEIGRGKFLISTKCGMVNRNGSPFTKLLSEKSIRAEIDVSLQRLGVDYIDIYHTHWPDGKTPFAETYGALSALIKEGKIRFAGACNLSLRQLKKIDKICPLAFVQNEFSFLRPEAGREIFDYCNENGIGFLAYGALGGGVLSGKYTSEPKIGNADARTFFYGFYKGKEFLRAEAAARKFGDVAKKYSVPAAAVALRWTAQSSSCVIPLAGAKKPEQVKQNCLCADFRLTDEDMDYLND